MPAPASTVAIPGGNASDLFRDIRAEFLSTYRTGVGRNAKLANVMRLGVSSDQRVERYGYYESTPTISRVDRSEALGEDAFRAISYEVANLTFGKAIGWHEEDLDDVKLGDFREQARMLATRAAQLPERIFFQILTGAADASLLSAIPLAPDGAALHATTAAGAARFGAVSGNLLTGTGVATSGAIRSDLWNAIEQWKLFQDTEGEPLLDEAVTEQGITIVYNSANEEVFREALAQGRTVDRAGGGQSVTNTILESGLKLTLWSTQRLTDNDWFVSLDGLAPRAVFEQLRMPPRMIEETRENSERARRNRIMALLLDMRAGYGINLPYASIAINN